MTLYWDEVELCYVINGYRLGYHSNIFCDRFCILTISSIINYTHEVHKTSITIRQTHTEELQIIQKVNDKPQTATRVKYCSFFLFYAICSNNLNFNILKWEWQDSNSLFHVHCSSNVISTGHAGLPDLKCTSGTLSSSNTVLVHFLAHVPIAKKTRFRNIQDTRYKIYWSRGAYQVIL